MAFCSQSLHVAPALCQAVICFSYWWILPEVLYKRYHKVSALKCLLIFLRFTHVFACINSSFFFCYCHVFIVGIHHHFFFDSFTCWCSFLAIVKKSVNFHEHIFFCVNTCFLWKPRITRSEARCLLNNSPKQLSHFILWPVMCESYSSFTSSPTLYCLSFSFELLWWVCSGTYCGFHCISLVISGVFIHLLAIWCLQMGTKTCQSLCPFKMFNNLIYIIKI